MVHEFSRSGDDEVMPPAALRSALLLPMLGEHHSLGLLLVKERIRAAGWAVHAPQNRSVEQILHIVDKEHFDMVGISVTCDASLSQLADLIGVIRKGSINRHVKVMVGGRVFNDHPEYVAQVGADATDVDGRTAVERFEQIAVRVRSH